MTIKALINNEMLLWARKRSFNTLDDAIKHLGIKKSTFEAWEKGDSQPTFRQAEKIAKKLKIPLGYLYLSEPPDESLPLPDLRVKPGVPPKDPSPDFLEVIYDAMRKQEWYRDYLIEEGADPLPFVGRFTKDAPVEVVANDIRDTLKITDRLRRQSRNMEDYYRNLVNQAENAGVLVIRNSVVGNNTNRPLDPNEFQGFAMPDKIAPMIFVNQKDYLSAQIFTLMHEIAHIWLGITGVSLQDYLEAPKIQDVKSQRIANKIAAETLIPAEGFIDSWRKYNDIDVGLENLRHFYKVSVFVIIRRAYDLGEISFDNYQEKFAELSSNITPKKKSSGGGGYKLFFTRNSTTLTTSLLHSVTEGKTLTNHASTLLNVNPITVCNMQSFLMNGML
jgi:Zn-dependent peptidase ImmA (M78 family)/DNA-binding XRE family transcriptional regulator